MEFVLEQTDPNSAARAGRIQTDHGVIETPIFMPVGTLATVKTVPQQTLRDDIRAQIILGNTYHLYLRPGVETLEGAGGLHRFMNWSGPLLTDSGGYQVYSLAKQRKLTEEGATFASHIDGSKHLFSPENVVDTQRSIGSDIMMVLDECPPYPCDYSYAEKSLGLTERWAKRCKIRWQQTKGLYGHSQALFPIVQGSVFADLRKRSCESVAELDLPGNAIGGLSVGEPKSAMYDMTELCCQILPTDKPRYLMGVGTPVDLLEGIERGVDMFDCVLPSRNARHGLIYTWEGIRNMKNARYAQDHSPLDPDTDLAWDQYYTKAYVRHLFKSNEWLGMTITSVHNLAFFLSLVKKARQKIFEGNYAAWKQETVKKLNRRL